MPLQPPLLLTYGTLMQAFDNDFALKLRANADYVGKGSFPGKLYRIDWYPGAVYDTSTESRVSGEIYTILKPDIIRELDDYEDVMKEESASLYLRKCIPVMKENGLMVECWVYLYNQPTDELALIPGGVFVP